MPSPLQAFGLYGQKVARFFLEKKGYEILVENYSALGGEIDLIGYDPREKIYILFEVKTRRSEVFGFAEEAITTAKIKAMSRAAGRYFFQEKHFKYLPEFEIHAITVFVKEGKCRIAHFKNVGWEWR